MSDQYDGYDEFDEFEEYEDYDYDYTRPDGMPSPMMPQQGQQPWQQGQQPWQPGQQPGQQGQPPWQPGQQPGQPGQPPWQPGQPPWQPGQPGLMPYAPGPHNFGQFAPTMRPPGYIPRRPNFFPGPIRQCRNRFAFIWLNNGRSFWAWIASVTQRVVYGYRWNGRMWVYMELNVNNINTFICIR